MNYGGRIELVDAARQIATGVRSGQLQVDDIDESTFAGFLYTAGMPELDLMIRTAGEMRISNFLLWQLSYAELWVTERCWPEFRIAESIARSRSVKRIIGMLAVVGLAFSRRQVS